ncbi:hypothetical protein [Chitinibacter tainanensis]|uniref:hypothetical protein n=1 Tax=Chitinibacter tainanensis TaxID=230667 RepID=UPI00048FCDD1|nr:hypothetical protein [Chitinibacter tainanensis]
MNNLASDLLLEDIEEVLPQVGKRFELITQIGNDSSFGAVWLAHDKWLAERKVALKISAHDLSDEGGCAEFCVNRLR